MEADEAPLERTSHGFHIPGTSIYIDPKEPVACAIISHAHGDHAIPGHDTVYCTYQTAKLLRARFQNFAFKIVTPQWQEVFQIEGINFRFASAGHMLGSAQVVWEKNNITTVYTGDYKRQFDESCDPFDVVVCDNFITETTFAQPGKIHPPPEDCLLALKDFPSTNFVIGAYSLGKAQRLTLLFNQFIPEFNVMVHPKIVKYHKIYEEAGFNLGKWAPFQRQVFRKEKGNIFLVPPPVLQNYTPSENYLRGMTSGWEHLQQGYELNLPISDHADWNELLQTITDSKAKKIFTVHGDDEQLKNYLSSNNIFVDSII